MGVRKYRRSFGKQSINNSCKTCPQRFLEIRPVKEYGLSKKQSLFNLCSYPIVLTNVQTLQELLFY